MPALDRYDREELDDEDYDPMSIEDRLAVEQELRRRDREEVLGRRGEDNLIYGIIVRCILLSFVLYCLYNCNLFLFLR